MYSNLTGHSLLLFAKSDHHGCGDSRECYWRGSQGISFWALGILNVKLYKILLKRQQGYRSIKVENSTLYTAKAGNEDSQWPWV